MREIKFRAWDTEDKRMMLPEKQEFIIVSSIPFGAVRYTDIESACGSESQFCWGDADLIGGRYELQQYTGLKDKNGDKEVYECDIIDSEGNIIGNQYETPALHEDKANLLIQGFGTKDWLTTYTQAVGRGCHDA